MSPSYDPTEDIAALDPLAHVVIVTAKATDFAQGNVRAALEPIRRASPSRPVVLCVTTLHEAIPRQPHPTPYPFAAQSQGLDTGDPSKLPGQAPGYTAFPTISAGRIEHHAKEFAGLFDGSCRST